MNPQQKLLLRDEARAWREIGALYEEGDYLGTRVWYATIDRALFARMERRRLAICGPYDPATNGSVGWNDIAIACYCCAVDAKDEAGSSQRRASV